MDFYTEKKGFAGCPFTAFAQLNDLRPMITIVQVQEFHWCFRKSELQMFMKCELLLGTTL